MTAPVWPVAVCTGHRPRTLATPDAIRWVEDQLRRIALKLAAEHATVTALSGMALGSDQMWAWTAVEDAGMRLWAHITPDQDGPWTADQKVEYRRLLALASWTTRDGERYDVQNLHDRNTGMVRATVECGGVCVAVLRSSKLDGGTRSAFGKALDAGVPVIHVDPDRRTVTLPRPKTRTTPEHRQETLPL